MVPGDGISGQMGSDLMTGKEEPARRKSDEFGAAPQDNTFSNAASGIEGDMSIL